MASSFRRLLLGSWRKPKNKTVPVEMEDGSTAAKIIKGAIRVKLVLSKKEAAQLLAMYVRGQEELEDNKLAGELERTKSSRRSSGSCSGSWRPMLESIPEN